MDRYIFNEQVNNLNRLKRQIDQEVRQFPSGTLSIYKRNEELMYRVRYVSENNREQVVYLTPLAPKDLQLINILAKKQYYQRLQKSLGEEIDALDKMLQFYDKNKDKLYLNQYDKLNPNIQKLVTPINEELIQAWKSRPYIPKTFSEDDNTAYFTDNGERVRSKSEILIANTLKKLGIPYKYECPLVLDNETTIYPDFTILDVRTYEEKYFEHNGRMDDLVYVASFMWRMDKYSAHGIHVGDRLFLSFESREYPLKTNVLASQLAQLFGKNSQ